MKSISATSPTGVKLLLVEVTHDQFDFDVLYEDKYYYLKGKEIGKTAFSYGGEYHDERILGIILEKHRSDPYEHMTVLGTVSKQGVDFDCSELVDETKPGRLTQYFTEESSRLVDIQPPQPRFIRWLDSIAVRFENKLPVPLMIDRPKEMEEFDRLEWEKWDAENQKVWSKICVIRID